MTDTLELIGLDEKRHREKNPVLWVDNQPLPEPAYRGYSTRKEELVKAQRNVGSIVEMTIENIKYSAEAGELVKRHIAWKYTIDVRWAGLTASEKNTIMSLTGTQKINLRFVDMDTDQILGEGMWFYRGSGQTITGWGKYDSTTMQFEHYDISMSLIQG